MLGKVFANLGLEADFFMEAHKGIGLELINRIMVAHIDWNNLPILNQ